ncbi:conserved hypothetical protein [Vibrio nigripulchritudo MADA3029]|uniref:inositol monophosphatase family protein n=1 Tax=Vibrio nigripulchritudo TaxID=28173 RepID=UPI0003B1BD9B|nr:inositol monophosphatase [Vibrio nigripulchritudo]CCN50702.1 conserved hypothetical protein [Vibrio nigripulchritudo MADA3020]CCN52273.1 conserved hypothetical protein [Vibrio nigripulchritudo MADA3021]CCN59165.1 conserved hypothetical protein [Vibrio nigripulchritudo MADA3029]
MNLTLDKIKELVQAARDAAKQEVMPYYRKTNQLSVQTKTSASDLVTIADQNSERFLSERITKILPDAEIIGEESVEEDPTLLNKIGSAKQCVIIDPIDGTWNFVKGLPLFGIIIAVVEKGETVGGVLYDPVADDWIYAIKGKGAFFGSASEPDKSINVASPAISFEEMEGFSPVFLFESKFRSITPEKFLPFERITTLRCSCHEYRVLAEGGVHFGLSTMLKPWDHAAGELIHREAGGYSALLESGNAYKPTERSGQLLLAPNKENWQKLQQHFLG